MFEGMAKPMPFEPPEREKIAVLTPARRPSMSISAPPELPGLIAASVWMKKPKSSTPIWLRASAETMPLVTVWPMPKGLPIASTRSPISRLSESANCSVGKLSSVVLDLQDREIDLLVLEQHRRVELAPVGEGDLDLVGVLDDVVVGDHQTGGSMITPEPSEASMRGRCW